MYKNMEMWTNVRRSVLTDKMSKRAACKKYKIHWDTLQKILANPEPPKDRRKTEREKPVLGPYAQWIHEILEADKEAPKKQRHTAKRIFDLIQEQGYDGGYTQVKEAEPAYLSLNIFSRKLKRSLCNVGYCYPVYRSNV